MIRLWSDSFLNETLMPERLAFGAKDDRIRIRLSENRNPHLAWSNLPHGTKSLALICVDHDAPSVSEDVNQAGKSLDENMPRTSFYHWTIWNISPDSTEIVEGQFSKGITKHGKPSLTAPCGAAQGLNDFSAWFANDIDMRGEYYGYDGPCPPWNDLRIHHYLFTLYALSRGEVKAKPRIKGNEVLTLIEPYILASTSLIGCYTLNPDLA